MKKSAALLAVMAVVGAALSPAQAAKDEWKGEITPYLWMAGMNGDASVSGHDVSVDYSFSDILDAADAAGSLLAVLQYGQVVFWGQLDYLSLDSDKLENPPAPGRIESDTMITTLAIGYQFQGSGGKTYDLLLGSRGVSIDNTLTLSGQPGSPFKHSRDIRDTVVVFRPSIPLSEKWRFNPTLSYGSGDSEKTYELWPQVQYHFSTNWAARLGYRRLAYEFEDGKGNSLDASFEGFVVGLGGTF